MPKNLQEITDENKDNPTDYEYHNLNEYRPFYRRTHCESSGGMPPSIHLKYYVVDKNQNRITVDLPRNLVDDIIRQCNMGYAVTTDTGSEFQRDRMVAHLVIPGQPTTKKTGNRIVRAGRFMKVMPSLVYVRYENSIVAMGKDIFVANPDCELPIDFPCSVSAHYYRGDKRRIDLAGLHQAMQDALVKAGVFKDDYHGIIHDHDGSDVRYDKANPRVEIFIYALRQKESPGT